MLVNRITAQLINFQKSRKTGCGRTRIDLSSLILKSRKCLTLPCSRSLNAPADGHVKHMGQIEIENFSDKDVSRIFIAASIKEAEAAEDILTQNGIDYAISLEPYTRMFFGTEREGVAFYVLSGQATHCRNLLASRGLSQGLISEEPKTL